MGWFSKSEKTIDDVFDKEKGLLAQVGGWVGNMSLTKEEVLEQNSKTVSSVQQFVVNTLSETTERSKSRRSFAQAWRNMHISMFLFCCIAAPFNMELAKFYLSLALSPWVCSITGAIVIFFFGSHGIRTYNERKESK